MLDKLLFTTPREHDPLTLRRARTLALISIVLMISSFALGLPPWLLNDTPARILNSFFTGAFVFVIYLINQSGRLRFAITFFLTGSTLVLIGTAFSPHADPKYLFPERAGGAIGLVWQTARSAQMGGGAYCRLICLESARVWLTACPHHRHPEMGALSIFLLELGAISLLWILAGVTYLTSQMLHGRSARARHHLEDLRDQPGAWAVRRALLEGLSCQPDRDQHSDSSAKHASSM